MNGQPTWAWWVRPRSKGLSKMHKYTPGWNVTWCGSRIPRDAHRTCNVPHFHRRRICQLCLAEIGRRRKLDLLPCPFCGSKPDIEQEQLPTSRVMRITIGCSSGVDVCPVNPVLEYVSIDGRKAMNAWNKRINAVR